MLHYDLRSLREHQPLSASTMLNEDMFDNDAYIDYDKVSRWKVVEMEIPEEISTDTGDIIIKPERRKDYRLHMPSRGTKKRVTGNLRLLDKSKEGYVAFTLASEDYGKLDPKFVHFGDVFIIRNKGNNSGSIEYHKYGEMRELQECSFAAKTLSFGIEKFPNKASLMLNNHALLAVDAYTSPSANQEFWISATTPVAIDNFQAYYEVGGKWNHPLFTIERSFSEGKFEMAADLANDMMCDIDAESPLMNDTKLYLAKSLARSVLHDKPDQGQIDMAMQLFRELERRGSREMKLDAGREIANILFFHKKDYWESFSQLSKMHEATQDPSGVIAQALWFSHNAPPPYDKAFRSLRKKVHASLEYNL